MRQGARCSTSRHAPPAIARQQDLALTPVCRISWTQGHVIEFPDFTDALHYVGVKIPASAATGITTPEKEELMPLLTKKLLARKHPPDTLKFSRHLDGVQACDQVGNPVANNDGSQLGCHCCPRGAGRQSRLLQQWVALRQWKPYNCPGHPALRKRGPGNTSAVASCDCETPSFPC